MYDVFIHKTWLIRISKIVYKKFAIYMYVREKVPNSKRLGLNAGKYHFTYKIGM